MWDTIEQFNFKTMRYQQSCFPCSLQVILNNLGYVGRDDSIEEYWEQLHIENTGRSLTQQAPTEEQVHSYIARTPELGNRGVVFSPTNFGQDTINEIVGKVNRDFVHATGPVGMIAGIGHAKVFFKDANNRVYHLNPSPDRENTYVRRVENLQAEAIVSDDETEWAVRLSGDLGDDQLFHAAQFIMIIS